MSNVRKKSKLNTNSALTSFSKNLMGLKFMQDAKKRVDKSSQDHDESFDSSICKDLKNRQQYIINASYQSCERLKFGRLSFKGMNTYIETIMYNNKLEEDNQSPDKTKIRSTPTSSRK